MSTFAADTAVRPVGQGGGTWEADIVPGWDIGGNANGGYLLAIAGRALLAETGRADPITVTAHYLSPGKPGPLRIPVRTVREGRRFSTAGATLLDGSGRPVLEVLATVGDLSAPGDHPTFLDGGPPELPSPEECLAQRPTVIGADGMPGGFGQRVDSRIHPRDLGFVRASRSGLSPLSSFLADAPSDEPLEPSQERSGEALVRAWFRLAGDEPMDTVGLLLAVDALPPTVFNLDLPVAWVPTIELTAHIRARPAPGWLQCMFRTRFISGGFLEEDGEVWDSQGALVAQSRQLALLPRA